MTEEVSALKKKTNVLKNMLFVLLVIWMVGVPGFLVWNGLQSTGTRTTLIDCTQTGGKCFERNQKQTVEYVKKLIDEQVNTQRIVIYTASCQDEPGVQSIPELTTCVEDRIRNARQFNSPAN